MEHDRSGVFWAPVLVEDFDVVLGSDEALAHVGDPLLVGVDFSIAMAGTAVAMGAVARREACLAKSLFRTPVCHAARTKRRITSVQLLIDSARN
jgi:hypothetical protein